MMVPLTKNTITVEPQVTLLIFDAIPERDVPEERVRVGPSWVTRHRCRFHDVVIVKSGC